MKFLHIKTYVAVLVNDAVRNGDGEPEEVALFVQADSPREAIITAIVKAESISGVTGWIPFDPEKSVYEV